MTPWWPIGSREDSLWEPPSPAALLLVIWESYMTHSRPKHTKIPPQTGEALTFDWKIAYNSIFLYKKHSQYIILKLFLRNRSVKKIFLLQAILSYICSKFRESYLPLAIRIRVNQAPMDYIAHIRSSSWWEAVPCTWYRTLQLSVHFLLEEATGDVQLAPDYLSGHLSIIIAASL